jgi:hypothetical protein
MFRNILIICLVSIITGGGILLISNKAYTDAGLHYDCIDDTHVDQESGRIYYEATHYTPMDECMYYCDHMAYRADTAEEIGGIYVEIWSGTNNVYDTYVETVNLHYAFTAPGYCYNVFRADKLNTYLPGNYEARYYHRGYEGSPWYCSQNVTFQVIQH